MSTAYHAKNRPPSDQSELFGPGRPQAIGTLFHLAKENGWREEAKSQTRANGKADNSHGPQPNGHADQRNETDEDLTPEEVEQEIARLAKLGAIEYERERKKAAKKLGFRPTTLDGAVKAARGAGDDTAGQGRPLSLPEPNPSDDLVDGCELLDALVETLRRYVVLGKNEARAIALWILHAYVFVSFTCTPRLAVTSPEKRCGKTTLMDVLARLLPRVLSVAGISAAAIFRTVELARPTLLIDEADTFLPQNEELRGVLNSGHRKGGNMVRLVGDGHEPRQFSTHAPVAIAMIGKLPNTLADRSIPIRLRRRRDDEKVQSFRADRTDALGRLASMASRWAIDNEATVRDADPEMDGLFNRDADNWRPLLAIADAAGGHWPARAREAARALVSDGAGDDESTGAMLFADIRAAFETRGCDRISSEDLVAYLHSCEDRPWPEFGKSGKPISKAQLARLLRQFRICSGSVRLGERTFKGYLRKPLRWASTQAGTITAPVASLSVSVLSVLHQRSQWYGSLPVLRPPATLRSFAGSDAKGARVLPLHIRGRLKTVDRDYLEREYGREFASRAAQDPDFVSPAEAPAGVINWNPEYFQRELARAKKEGFSGVRFARVEEGMSREPSDQIALFSPADVRSTNARFDPRRRSSANLLSTDPRALLSAIEVGPEQ